ncbi:MAG: hypothetical protein K6A92_01855 [Lachnospiraceae bacterium]|nr:hypothetical protein [Lachnospiraceae bacterium]
MARKLFTIIAILLVIAVVVWILQYNEGEGTASAGSYAAVVETIAGEIESRGSEAVSSLETLGGSLDGMLSDAKENGIPDLELESKGEELYQSFTEDVAEEPKEATDDLIRRKTQEFFEGIQKRFTDFFSGLLHG